MALPMLFSYTVVQKYHEKTMTLHVEFSNPWTHVFNGRLKMIFYKQNQWLTEGGEGAALEHSTVVRRQDPKISVNLAMFG